MFVLVCLAYSAAVAAYLGIGCILFRFLVWANEYEDRPGPGCLVLVLLWPLIVIGSCAVVIPFLLLIAVFGLADLADYGFAWLCTKPYKKET